MRYGSGPCANGHGAAAMTTAGSRTCGRRGGARAGSGAQRGFVSFGPSGAGVGAGSRSGALQSQFRSPRVASLSASSGQQQDCCSRHDDIGSVSLPQCRAGWAGAPALSISAQSNQHSRPRSRELMKCRTLSAPTGDGKEWGPSRGGCQSATRLQWNPQRCCCRPDVRENGPAPSRHSSDRRSDCWSSSR